MLGGSAQFGARLVCPPSQNSNKLAMTKEYHHTRLMHNHVLNERAGVDLYWKLANKLAQHRRGHIGELIGV